MAVALGLFAPTDEQAAVIAAPPGPLVVIAGAGAGKTETMAARVVWLVANGYAAPGEVLGLTFTRKAAGQLLRRVRSRLARLAGAGIVPGGRDAADDPGDRQHLPRVRGHAAARARPAAAGRARHPAAQRNRVVAVGFRVVTRAPRRARHRQDAGHRSPAMVLRLAGQLAEHLVDTDQLRDTHVELERLVHTLPAGPYQRDRGPSQWLLRMLATQTERTELVPLIDALHERMRAEKVMDFGMQMSAAARLASTFPQVGEQLRQRYRVVLLDEYQDTGHAQRVALSSLFGGGVDDGLALTAVGDPIQSIYGWRGASATNLPRFTTDFPPLGRQPRADAGAAHQLAQSAAGAASGQRGVGRGAAPVGGGAAAAAAAGRRNRAPSGARCSATSRPNVTGSPTTSPRRYREASDAGDAVPTAAVLVRRNADAAPMADALTRTGRAGRGRRAGGAAGRPRGRRRGGDAAPGRRPHRGRGRDAGAHRAALAARRPRRLRAVAPRRRTRRRRRGARSRRRATQIVADAAPGRRRRLPGRRDRRPGNRGRYSPEGHRPHRRARPTS